MKKKIDFDNLFKNLGKTWTYVKKYKSNLFIYILISLIISGIGVLLPYLTSRLLIYLTGGKFNLLIIVSFLVLITEIFRKILSLISYKVYTLVFQRITLNIRLDIIREIFSLTTSEFDKNSSGVFIDRIVNDCNSLARIFESISRSLITIFTNIGVLVAVFFISKIMFLFIIVSFVLIYFIEKIRIKKRIKNRKEWLKIGEINTGISNEFIRGIRDVKSLHVEDGFVALVEKRLYEAYNKEYELVNMNNKYNLIGGLLDYILAFLFIVLGVFLLDKNMLTIDNFVVIYMYKDRANRLIWDISSFIESLKDYNLSANRVFEIVESEEFIKEKFGTHKLDNFKGSIEFKDVNFSYNGEKKVLKNLSFVIPANKTIALVGKSGSGKSTIASLINKLYHVSDDSIFFDDVDINFLDKESIRGNIALVTQNPYLFNLSIIDNFKLVKNDATLSDIIEACKIASIHDDIIKLENGYDTIIGEGGVILSGGQRQRISIARALIKNAKVIIFDEATSALDNETQKSVKEAIDNIKGEQTIIIIAHRLSTVINSDIIYFLKNGRIISSGTHKELLRKCEDYKKLYKNET